MLKPTTLNRGAHRRKPWLVVTTLCALVLTSPIALAGEGGSSSTAGSLSTTGGSSGSSAGSESTRGGASGSSGLSDAAGSSGAHADAAGNGGVSGAAKCVAHYKMLTAT